MIFSCLLVLESVVCEPGAVLVGLRWVAPVRSVCQVMRTVNNPRTASNLENTNTPKMAQHRQRQHNKPFLCPKYRIQKAKSAEEEKNKHKKQEHTKCRKYK